MKFFEDFFCTDLRDRGFGSILAALSGGADSVSLLRLLLSPGVKREFPSLRVEAVHCNFHLRGAESDRDMEFCRALCRSLGVRLHIVHFDVEEYRRFHGVSVEMACRELRYARFRELLSELGFDRVAVAHNADDNIETMLLNLMRGSGVSGLSGMEADNGWVYRPLLRVPRSRIDAWLAELGQSHIEDSTNSDTSFRRNFIRHELLPLMESRYPGVRAALTRSIRILGEEKRIVGASLDASLSGCDAVLPVSLVRGSKAPVSLVHRFLSRYGGSGVQAEEVARNALSKDVGGASWKLGEKWILERGVDSFRLSPLAGEEGCGDLLCEEVPFGPRELERARGEGNGVLYLPKPLDCYEARHWRPGDRMSPIGIKGTVLVANLMRDCGIPPSERARRRLVCRPSDGEVIWVEGVRRSRMELVDPGVSVAYRISKKKY